MLDGYSGVFSCVATGGVCTQHHGTGLALILLALLLLHVSRTFEDVHR